MWCKCSAADASQHPWVAVCLAPTAAPQSCCVAPLCPGSLVDDEEEAIVTSDTTVIRTVVLPITGPATNIWDTSNLASSILTYLDGRGATTSPPPSIAVVPAAGGINMAITFPPGSNGTAGALTLLADAEPPLTPLVNALVAATNDNDLILDTPFAVAGDYVGR